ncbi:hypothetical protein CHS0354_003773 [Potamilus streckersoni]|uniref:Cysteine proteinase inhibitor n=1 Tax=Potamilus streckersoni TaxID=2493646 RepID=A0AAE0VGU5_9BIVA|nr:hypothetical protein CHS0354_003773 [Potamilus streckersoni]
MKKVVILVGFVGLCLASPYSPVYEKDNNDLKTKEAALLALGADFDDEEACKGATLFGYIKVTYLSRISGSNPGDVYNLHLTIKRADEEGRV